MLNISSNKIREFLKKNIDEADNETIEQLWNQNFEEEITYIWEIESFEISEEEAESLGITEN
jgi:hypothetical protein